MRERMGGGRGGGSIDSGRLGMRSRSCVVRRRFAMRALFPDGSLSPERGTGSEPIDFEFPPSRERERERELSTGMGGGKDVIFYYLDI